MSKCPLCKFGILWFDAKQEGEHVFHSDIYITIVRTKKLKGHRERIMVITKAHLKEIPSWLRNYAMLHLKAIGKIAFNYTPKFVIMDSTFASLPKHWHLVATDLEYGSEDHKQILETKWIEVVETDWNK